VLLEIVLLGLFFALGLGMQRHRPSDRLRELAWDAYWWTITSTLVFTSFSTIEFDRELGLALAAAVLASWLVIALGYGYARAVAAERDERGALALGAGFPNTGFVGYPLAQLALGTTASRSWSCTTASAGSSPRRQCRPRSPACTGAARRLRIPVPAGGSG
jgi:hypothetical protein